MKKVVIKTKKADFKQGKFIDESVTVVVASTKSQNNVVEELVKSGVIVTEQIEKDIYLDKQKTLDAVNKSIDEQISDIETAECVKKHVASVLNIGCLFVKPKK